jgi:sugar fermentation stimulation protein A
MEFHPSLIEGQLIKRYKRFMADIELEDGQIITAHCPNSGAMVGICEPGSRVWVSQATNPERKLKYTWHLVEADQTIVGMNTSWPNVLVEEAIRHQKIAPLTGYDLLRREVKYGTNSRIDILLESPHRPSCYVEVKNVHLRRDTVALFPDCVTARGTKHLNELAHLVSQGIRAVMIYVIQREDCDGFSFASDLDPLYAKTAQEVFNRGVEAYAYACQMSPNGIEITREVPVLLL